MSALNDSTLGYDDDRSNRVLLKRNADRGRQRACKSLPPPNEIKQSPRALGKQDLVRPKRSGSAARAMACRPAVAHEALATFVRRKRYADIRCIRRRFCGRHFAANGRFLESIGISQPFEAKGRLRSYLEAVPSSKATHFGACAAQLPLP
jgi:hypothetical protein